MDLNNVTIQTLGWREPWAPTDKPLAYAFSLDVNYRVSVTGYTGVRLRLSAIEAPERSTYHVLDDALTKGADGALHDVPRGRVVGGDDWMDLCEAGVGLVSGVLVLQTEPSAEPLKMEYRGVAHLPRGFERVLDEGRPSQVPGTACIATRHECVHPKYRWLAQQRLYGFGQVFLEQERPPAGSSACTTAACRLKFSFDLYSGV